ncbi:MAG: ABC transporter permease subunit [Acetobacteraceae bacterium]|nr:ABC transporter permease subunit [Acetobacteraceae bacterium]
MSGVALSTPSGQRQARLERLLDPLLVATALLALWQAAADWTGGIALATPWQTVLYLTGLVGTPMFWGHAGATIGAFLLAFAISAVLGLGLGLLLGLRRFAGEVAEPILAGFYTIPKVTLYPVVLLLFGLGMSAKVAFGVMHGLVPVTLFTLGAVRTLPPVLVRTARVLRLSAGQAMRSVLIPACLPDIVNGLRVGFSLSLLGVLIGEMFSSQRGLGFLLVNGLAQHNVALTTSVVLVVVVGAIVANTLMLRLGRRITHQG